MLTPTDVHYLVGLLSHLAGPEDVELEFGSMVLDTAAEEERDVDVTLRAGPQELRGIEVKAHRRPLDSTHVEQLCAKMSDMPAINRRAIVSASGYYDPARRKAEKHGVELLRLEPWDREKRTFGATTIPRDFQFGTERTLVWQGKPKVRDVEVDWEGRADVRPKRGMRVTDDEGGPIADASHMGALEAKIADRCRRSLESNAEWRCAEDNLPLRCESRVTIADRARVWAGRKSGIIRSAWVTGWLVWRTNLEPQFRILVRDKDESPFIACALVELANGDLLGIALKAELAPLPLFLLSISDRNRNKIRRQKFPARA